MCCSFFLERVSRPFFVYFIPIHPSQVTHHAVQAWARYKVRVPIFPSITLNCSFLSGQDSQEEVSAACLSESIGCAATDSRVSHSPWRPMPWPLMTPA